jgi:mannose-6-phosphate isomerase-like protein (cupin superfamily)
MKHPAFALLLMLAMSPPLAAQTGRRGTTPPATNTTVLLTVTDGKGAALGGVTVRVSGAVDREAQTASDGTLSLQGLRSGAYRFRFTRDGFVTLERDVTVPAGQRTMDQHVMMSAGERAAVTPAETAKPAKPALPAPGKAVTVSLPAYIEQNFIGGTQPQKVSTVACSGLAQSVLWQIREPWVKRQHENAEAMLYTVGGEGLLRMNERDLPLEAGTFVSVPRGTVYSVTRRGRNPLIVLATLAGEACSP